MPTRREVLQSALAALPVGTVGRIDPDEAEPLCVVLEVAEDKTAEEMDDLLTAFIGMVDRRFPNHPICQLPFFITDPSCRMRIERRSPTVKRQHV